MVPLTVRSHYSLMWGTASIAVLCKTARRMGYTRLALTDTDNLYGLWPFLSACRREGIVPIVGAEVTEPGTGRRVVCLVENESGYGNLCRLLTRRHMDVEFSIETAVSDLADGLWVLTGNADLLAACHNAGRQVAAAMPRRPLPRTHRLCRLAQRLGVPLLATPGNFFLNPEEVATHRLLRAIDRNTSLSRITPDRMAPGDAWLADAREYTRRFAICPEAIHATHALADRLTFTGPAFGIVMPPWHTPDGRDAVNCLREATYAGAHDRYGSELPEPVINRIEHELGIIAKMNFSAYFLAVRDIVRQSPRICGRGSGAASLVAYCLQITNVCPLKHNLYFERFLNPGRKDPPDIDVDFAWDERDRVLDTVLSRYRGHAAMVSSHVLMQPRMAIRETAKVYGLTDAEIGRVAKRLPDFWRTRETDPDLMAALKTRPEARCLALPPPWPEIVEMARRITGSPRYLSVHPGGIVITPDPIDTYVPIQRAPKGVPIIQWEKDAAEDAGLVKIDLLGNRSLGVIRDAVENVRQNHLPFDESRWEPEDDPITRQSLAQGRTMGCFYIESPAMRLLQQKTGVGDFEHLVIHSSIIRPAANDFIQEYIRRLHGGAWDPIHPFLADVLNETFGIMVYQEDVSRAAVALAGFSHADADGLRKILSKKDREQQLRDFRARFMAGATAKGVPRKKADAVWAMIMSFNGYSFCKPHSASYARVSFQAAYLKVHHPAEFMAAVISNQGGFYSTFAYVSEARRMGLTVLPPDVNQSDIRWTGNGRTLRVGLLSIKGLSATTRARVVAQRNVSPFAGMVDFLRRVRPDDAEARMLIRCGALDPFSADGNRAALMWEVARWQASLKRKRRDQALFFREHGGDAPPAPILPPENQRDRLRREFSALGFLCDRHPMQMYGERLKDAKMEKALDLPRRIGKRVRLAAWLITGKKVRTKHGESMEFLTFEDETGIVETTFFPETYRRFAHMIDWGRPYLLAGKVEQDWGAVTLTVDNVAPMERPA